METTASVFPFIGPLPVSFPHTPLHALWYACNVMSRHSIQAEARGAGRQLSLMLLRSSTSECRHLASDISHCNIWTWLSLKVHQLGGRSVYELLADLHVDKR